MNIPYLGKRQCYVLDDCPPAISVGEEINTFGSVFIWTSTDGPRVVLSDGTIVYLHNTNTVPELDEECRAETPSEQGTETSTMPGAQCFGCQPCVQPGGLFEQGGITKTATLTEAETSNQCCGCNDRSSFIPTPRSKKRNKVLKSEFLAVAAKEQRQWCPERQKHGITPTLVAKEDEPTPGNRHRSCARSKSAKHQKEGETLECSPPPGLNGTPFFIEMFSGSGRLAEALRARGITAYEFDLNQKGGRKNLLDAKVLREVKDLLEDPNCIGIWFGFPCGTFSSASRVDGGPPPLRGTNSKGMWGHPHLHGTEKDRVKAANTLLLRMHDLMRHCGRQGFHFYLENSQTPKLWRHPLVAQWSRHGNTTNAKSAPIGRSPLRCCVTTIPNSTKVLASNVRRLTTLTKPEFVHEHYSLTRFLMERKTASTKLQ